ncbi:hypothetical protein SLITK23_10320 [Streptomyces lividans]|nr:hypothetical protein SLITK23_10320 [Streptomyces lividans]
MTDVEDEPNSQPACWTRAAAEAARHAAALPAAGERVAIIGCGTSYFMAQSAAALRQDAGQGETDAFAASAFPRGGRTTGSWPSPAPASPPRYPLGDPRPLTPAPIRPGRNRPCPSPPPAISSAAQGPSAPPSATP